ncbi:MAG TPA: hypothetical protein VK436_04725 [Methanocella sp.]|nr:hypothetical protein [Methanocella sp.]
MVILLLGFVLIFCAAQAYATPGNIIWQKTFGGAKNDYANSIQLTSDGGYIIAGSTDSYGGSDQLYLAKTDANGALKWNKTFNGVASDADRSVQQTSDGGYIMVGSTRAYGNGWQMYLVKTKVDGSLQWQKAIGGTGDEFGESVQQTSNGGYIITGNTTSFGGGSFVYLVNVSPTGAVQWQEKLGNQSSGFNQYDGGMSVQQTKDGGYIVSGYLVISPMTGQKLYLIKVKADGKEEWENSYGLGFTNIGCSVQETANGGYIVGGTTHMPNSNSQMYLVKTNANGALSWEKSYDLGLQFDPDCTGYSVIQPKNGNGYLLVGKVSLPSNAADEVYMVKVSSTGALQWQSGAGSIASNDAGMSVRQASDGNYTIAGVTSISDTWPNGSSPFINGTQVYLLKVSAK